MLVVTDNLALVKRILEGHNREEQDTFVAFRSHYVFASHFCTPGEGHEKGLVENLIGKVRRDCFVPLPEVTSFVELNQHLLDYCEKQNAGPTAYDLFKKAGLIGCARGMPSDLATNPKYMEGFGRD